MSGNLLQSEHRPDRSTCATTIGEKYKEVETYGGSRRRNEGLTDLENGADSEESYGIRRGIAECKHTVVSPLSSRHYTVGIRSEEQIYTKILNVCRRGLAKR